MQAGGGGGAEILPLLLLHAKETRISSNCLGQNETFPFSYNSMYHLFITSNMFPTFAALVPILLPAAYC